MARNHCQFIDSFTLAFALAGTLCLSLGAATFGQPPEPVLHLSFDRWEGHQAINEVRSNQGLALKTQHETVKFSQVLADGMAGKAFRVRRERPAQIAMSRQNTPRVKGGFTISAWVRPTDAKRHTIVNALAKPGGDPQGFRLLLFWHSEMQLEIRYGKEKQKLTTEDYAVEAGFWTHIAAVYDEQHLRLFVNGVQKARQSMPNDFNFSLQLPCFVIGTHHWQFKQGFDGRIDELRFYDQPLSAKQLVEIAASDLASSDDS
jgi:hypothetical protein